MAAFAALAVFAGSAPALGFKNRPQRKTRAGG
jgi:hypothetical protein